MLFVMAGASRQQGSDLLALFYPDSDTFWLGLGLGVPAALGLLLTGYRQRWPRLWHAALGTVRQPAAEPALTLWQSGGKGISPRRRSGCPRCSICWRSAGCFSARA